VGTTRQTILGLRTDIDAALRQPLDGRDSGLSARIYDLSTKELARLDEVSQEIGGRIRSLDMSLMRFLVVRNTVGITRNAQGNTVLAVSNGLRQGQNFTPLPSPHFRRTTSGPSGLEPCA